jgi:hypothetical protein
MASHAVFAYGRALRTAAVARRILEAATSSIAFVIFIVLAMDLMRRFTTFALAAM